MVVTQRDKLLVGLAGEFFVAGKLCQKGYVASLTLKNYPDVDIFVLNPRNKKEVAVQVKSKDYKNDPKNPAYFVPEKIEEKINPFVFVYIDKDENINYYILNSKEVAQISKKQREDYIQRNPHVSKTQPRMINLEALKSFKDRWDLLGLD